MSVDKWFYGVVPSAAFHTEAEVMRMTIVEALNFLLAVAGLVLSAYALGKQDKR